MVKSGKNVFLVLFCSSLLLLLFLGVMSRCAVAIKFINGPDRCGNEIFKAFEKVLEAYQVGGDVGYIVKKLNDAINLAQKGEISKALSLTKDAENEALQIKEAIINSKETRENWLIFGASVLIVVTLIMLFVSPIRISIKSNESKKNRKNRGLNEALAFTLTVVIIVAAFVYTEGVYKNQTFEPFSELSILGPNMEMGDYPSEVKVNEIFRLYVYVANHMGKPMCYFVVVKYAPINATINPSSGTVIQVSERILLDNETYIFPFELAMKEKGFWRLIVELWAYNASSGDVEYLSPYWGQIWLNATL
jgi:hypothetical protein